MLDSSVFVLDRRIPMVLHSLALHDVVTLWVENMFILDRSEGLEVLAGVSSSVHCHLSVSLAEWTLVMFFSVIYFVILQLGASLVKCSSLPHSLLWLSSGGFSSCGFCSAFGCGTLW